MAAQEIIKDIEKLSVRANEIAIQSNREEVNQIVQELKDTIIENNLTHLAAPQIGYDKRIFCLNFNGDIRTFINPMIINVEDIVLSRENCASLDSEYIIPRHKSIAAAYQTPTGKTESNRFLEPASHLFEQCQDLIDGILLSDLGLEITKEFDDAPEVEKEEVIAQYLQELQELQVQLEDEIENDEMLKKTSDAINFMDSVIRGETELKPVEERPLKINRATRRMIKKVVKKKDKLVS